MERKERLLNRSASYKRGNQSTHNQDTADTAEDCHEEAGDSANDAVDGRDDCRDDVSH